MATASHHNSDHSPAEPGPSGRKRRRGPAKPPQKVDTRTQLSAEDSRELHRPDRRDRQVAGGHRVRAGRHDPHGQRQLPARRWATRSRRSRGQHHRMFVDEAYRQSCEYQEFWARLARGEYQAGEYKRIGKGGARGLDPGIYNPILDLDGTPFKVVKYATDVTAAEAPERRLRRPDRRDRQVAGGHRVRARRHDPHGQRQLPARRWATRSTRSRASTTACSSTPAYRQSHEYREFWADLGRGEYQAGEFKRIGKGGKRSGSRASYNPILDLNGRPFKVVKYADGRHRPGQAADRLQAVLEKVARNAEALGQSAEELTAVSQQMAPNAEETAAQANVVVGRRRAGEPERADRGHRRRGDGREHQEIAKNANEAARVATAGRQGRRDDQRHRGQARREQRRDRQRHQGHHRRSPSRRTCWP